MRFTLFITLLVGLAFGLMVPPTARRGSGVAAIAPAPPPLSPSNRRSTSAVTVEAPLEAPRETILHRAPGGHFLALVHVNGMPLRFVVDTGADTVALTEADARQANVAFDPGSFEVIGRGASGDVRGQEVVIESLVLDGKRATDVRAVVIEGGDISLLGHTYLRQLQSVSIEGDQMRLR